MKVVVVGGGTGTYTVLSGLKKFPLELTAIVAMSDSGGSTGRLRDEFGFLPVGDSRMALVALAEDDREGEILRKLFLYRFNKGEGLRGHNFGNLFLVALSDILGSQEEAISYASEILRIKGKVIPVTKDDSHLLARYEDEQIIFGETNIDEPKPNFDGKQRIVKLWLQPEAKISPTAQAAMEEADAIILGPGDLYTSLLANIVVKGVPEAIASSRAKLIYVVNLIAKYGQTYKMAAKAHVTELRKYISRDPDFVLINNHPLPKRILKKYELEQGFPVENDLQGKFPFRVVSADLLGSEEIKKPSGDVLKRSLIRHDPDKLAKEIIKLIK